MGFAKSIINAVLLHHLHRFCFQSWESFRTVQRRGKNNFSHINSTTSYEVGLDVEKSERAYFWVLFCLLCFYAYSCRQDIFIFFFFDENIATLWTSSLSWREVTSIMRHVYRSMKENFPLIPVRTKSQIDFTHAFVAAVCDEMKKAFS